MAELRQRPTSAVRHATAASLRERAQRYSVDEPVYARLAEMLVELAERIERGETVVVHGYLIPDLPHGLNPSDPFTLYRDGRIEQPR
jgi:hypothetical protein